MATAQETLNELEDQFILGEILESDYRDKKRELIQQIRKNGGIVDSSAQIKVAEIKDKRDTPFCYIPEGPFYYGPDDEERDIKCAYYISKFPVTQGQFMEFLSENDIGYTDEDFERLKLVSPDASCPVSHISYNDAKEYCRWLRRVTGEYYSLPHEVEWEKAARGEDGRFYPWGNKLGSEAQACYQGSQVYDSTIPVDAFIEQNVSPYGCIDMVGNVWEWCLDTFDDERDPHILRGGSWCNDQDYANCLARTYSFPPTKRADYGGFRVIYLPSDMLEKYREHYSNLSATNERRALKVVMLGADKEERQKKKLKVLSQAIDSGASKDDLEATRIKVHQLKKKVDENPSNFDAEFESSDVNDVIASMLSQAADQYLKPKNDEPKDLSSFGNKSGDKSVPVGKSPTYKSIDEIHQSRKEKTESKSENFDKSSNTQLEFVATERGNIKKAKEMKIPVGLTAATSVGWAALFVLVWLYTFFYLSAS